MVAFVTGGSGGLGSAIVRRLAHDGHVVAIGCYRRREVAERLAGELSGRRAIAVQVDVTDAGAVERCVAGIAGDLGGLDILVNAAAHNVDGLLNDLSPVDVARMHEVNIAGTVNAIRAALPHLIAGGRGRVVNFSSVLAARALAGVSAYASTKGAIEALTHALAVELGPKRVTVNALAPGFIDAGLGKKPVERMGSGLRAVVPMRRAGTADEVAAVVSFLVSEAASYVSGAILPVDGGLQAGSPSLEPARSEGAEVR